MERKKISLENKHIDYKDTETLKMFLDPLGRIMPSRTTKTSRKVQRAISRAVKNARFMGLLPYVSR